MKKLIAAALLVVGITAFAQEQTQSPERAEMEKLSPEQRNQNQLKRMTEELNLNADQQVQIGKILAEQSEKREAMKAKREEMKTNQTRPSDEQRAAFKKQREDERNAMNEKMKSILTPEQFEKWKSDREKRESKMMERRGMKSE